MDIVKASHGQSHLKEIKVSARIAWGCELLLVVLLLFATVSTAVAKDVYVDSSYSGPEEGTSENPFTSVQMALRYVSSGDTLYVKGPYEYPGPVTFSVPVTVKAWQDSPTIGSGLGVLLHRIYYRPLPLVWSVNPEFPEWNAAGVSPDRQKEIFIAPYWLPRHPEDVKYVFFFSAGQQAILNPCVTTGQYNDWDDFPVENTCVYRVLNNQSIAGQIIAQQTNYPYGPENTLLLLAFRGLDSICKDHEEQEKIVQGYHDWFAGKMSSFENIEIVYLCGASRGGALAVRLGRRIRKLYNYGPADQIRPKILISCLDGVADENLDVPGQDEGELMATSIEILNPTDTTGEMYGHYALWFGEDGFFGGDLSRSLKVYQIMGEGLPNVPVFGQRCFVSGLTPAQAGENPVKNAGGFYSHKWVNLNHETICNAWHEDVTPTHLSWFFSEAFDENSEDEP